MCIKNPKNSSCRDTQTSGVEIVRNQGGLGVRYQQHGVDDDGEADEGEGVNWKYAAFENVDWEVVCRFRGRLVGEVPRAFASYWRKTLEALAEDAMTESNERRIFVVAAFKMKDALVWRHILSGNRSMVQRQRIRAFKEGYGAMRKLVVEYLSERE